MLVDNNNNYANVTYLDGNNNNNNNNDGNDDNDANYIFVNASRNLIRNIPTLPNSPTVI